MSDLKADLERVGRGHELPGAEALIDDIAASRALDEIKRRAQIPHDVGPDLAESKRRGEI